MFTEYPVRMAISCNVTRFFDLAALMAAAPFVVDFLSSLRYHHDSIKGFPVSNAEAALDRGLKAVVYYG